MALTKYSTFRHFAMVLIFVGIALRFYDLTLKPIHFDEGVNGHFVNTIWELGFFKYDPGNYHGPLPFYLFHLSEILFGQNIGSYRGVSVLASVGVLLLLPLFRGHVFKNPISFFITLAVLSLSPGMIFFGRSAIHEPVFLFFQCLFYLGLAKFLDGRNREGPPREVQLQEHPHRKSIWILSIAFVGTLLTKETFTLFYFSLTLFLGYLMVVHRSSAFSVLIKEEWGKYKKTYLQGFFIVLLPWLTFYSGFFQNLDGVADFFKAFIFWGKTGAEASGHAKPFYYFVELIWQNEPMFLLGSPFVFWGAIKGSRWYRFFSLIGLLQLAVYSAIPYKTPWCSINFYLPMAFSIGLGCGELLAKFRRPIYILVFGVLTGGASLLMSVKLNFKNCENPEESYVYVQSRWDLKNFFILLERISQSRGGSRWLRVDSLIEDSWPIPWVLSRYDGIRYLKRSSTYEGNSNSDVVIAEVEDRKKLAHLTEEFQRHEIRLRAARRPIDIYTAADLKIEIPENWRSPWH